MTPEDERTLGRLAFETQFHPDGWADISDFHKNAWEEAATAVRDKVMEWKTIETAPKDGTHILICFNGEGPVLAFYDCDSLIYPWQIIERQTVGTPGFGQSFKGGQAKEKAPSHWMPLPSPPCVPDRKI